MKISKELVKKLEDENILDAEDKNDMHEYIPEAVQRLIDRGFEQDEAIEIIGGVVTTVRDNYGD